MTFEYWFMFPVAALIATVAMASGVEGATFFVPVFMLGLKLPPSVAIGTGLITEVFGFASGLFAYARKRLIDYKLGLALLVVTVPMAVVGTVLSGVVPPLLLKVIFAVGLVVVALSFLKNLDEKDVALLDDRIQVEYSGPRASTTLVSANGESISYTVCNKKEGRLIAGIGGLFMGMISTGLGEMNGYFLLQRCKVPSKVSVATSVFVISITALLSSAGHFVRFATGGGNELSTVLSIVMFTAPGVVIGGQIGARIASRIPQRTLELTLAVLFLIVAGLTLYQSLA
ncbi:MAG: sulfite exporter TauE/SafE family protein [Spirochaetae bacterium HGW-Spirochaetae-7]|jgi:hypothetical protein|nr:MAG: sulfite exporter TauE/SafE family protein [Spirochaetae bacterium HGW-Spirochaetae-7]